jgi:hypothetical protein
LKTLRLFARLGVCGAAALALGCGSVLPNNHPPTISEIQVNGKTVPVDPSLPAGSLPRVTVAKGSTVVLTCLAGDEDTDPLSFVWQGGASPVSDPPSNYATYSSNNEGKSTITCVVRDDRDGVVSAALDILVVDQALNHPPTATLATSAATVAPGGTLTVTCTAADPDSGDTLKYTFFATRGTIAQTASDPTKPDGVYTAPATAGDDTLLCVVTDGKGSFVTAVAQVKVQ